MHGFVKRLVRDMDGGALVEASIAIPFLITFLMGGVDFMNAYTQWSMVAKAAEVGARIAAVSDPVATGMSGTTNIATQAVTSTVLLGDPMPYFKVTCDGAAAACTCTAGTCTGMGSYSAAAMNKIVYGRNAVAGTTTCPTTTSYYFRGMCNAFSVIQPKYVSIVYTQTGLGYAGRPGGAVPTVTVSINTISSADKLKFRFFFLPFASINIPAASTTITGEVLSSAAQS